MQQKQNPLGDFKPRGGEQVLEELRAVHELVTAKATPQEAEAFRSGWWPRPRRPPTLGRRRLHGLGAERVSAGEQRMLEQVRAAVGVA